jgi:hypothetical protein
MDGLLNKGKDLMSNMGNNSGNNSGNQAGADPNAQQGGNAGAGQEDYGDKGKSGLFIHHPLTRSETVY